MHFLETLLQKHFTERNKFLQSHALLITSNFFILPKQSHTFAFKANPLMHLSASLFNHSLSELNQTTTPSLHFSNPPLLTPLSGMPFMANPYAVALYWTTSSAAFSSSHFMLSWVALSMQRRCSMKCLAQTWLLAIPCVVAVYYSVIQLFRRLIHESENVFGNIRPNEATFVCVLSASASLDNGEGLTVGTKIHAYMIRHQIHLTALIDLYAKHGLLHSCDNTFKATIQKEVCTWNAMIFALVCDGKEAKALHMFDKMPSEGVVPNHITLLAVLTACFTCRFGGFRITTF